MHLHFSEEELAGRRARTIEAMSDEGLHGLLIFRQETMFYLTGYDTFGYVFFQCLYLGADGRMVLLTRAPDLRQAQQTSIIKDVRVWVDVPDARPAEALKGILQELGLSGKTLGVEYEAYGLTARNGKRLEAALDGFCKLVDASDLVNRQRVVKSAREIDYVRRAGELADAAVEAAIPLIRPGGDESDILAAMQGEVFRGGGDYPGNEFIIGSAEQALLCRYYSGRRVLSQQDQLTLEWAGAYRHYHAAMMHTAVVGKVPARQREMHTVARDALLAVEAKLVPGNTVGEAFDAHAAVLDKAGFQAHRMNACGYSLGTTFSPNWMDWPMLYHGNPVVLRAGMVFFVHIIIFDDDAGLAMTLGRTSLIGDAGSQSLSHRPLDLIVGG